MSSGNNNYDDYNTSFPSYDEVLSSNVKFWCYLVFFIPSIICSFFVLYYLLLNRTLRHALNNHVIVIILFIGLISEVTIFPWMFYFYQYRGIWRRSNIFCEIWGFLDWGLYVTQTILFAWAAIERHILIFHDRWVSTRKKRFFVHYLPLILLLLYCLIFYVIVYFFPFCKNVFHNSNMLCASTCLSSNYIFSRWEMIVHQILPALIIIVFSIAVVVRVVWQKYYINQPIQWRRHRKMTIQLLSITILYLLFFFPYALYNLMLTYGASYRLFRDFSVFAEFFAYYMTLLLPFVCASLLPAFRTKLLNLLHLRRQRRIDIKAWPMRAVINNQVCIK